MKRLVIASVAVTLMTASAAYAQRGGGGHGGGGHGGGGGGTGGGGGRSGGGSYQGRGGGTSGRGMGMGQAPATSQGHSRPASSHSHSHGHAVASHPSSHGYAYNHAPHQFSNRSHYHGGWYHGDWNGHGYGGRPWGYYPSGWGWYGGGWYGGGWGLGWGYGPGVTVGVYAPASPWIWGYYGYYNPYWVAPIGGVTYINYSQPIVVAAAPVASSGTSSASAARPTPQQTQALAVFDNARGLFRQGQYQAALKETDRALAITPNDSLMHEFRALCLFSLRDYQQSAAAVHAVLTAGPGWDWATVSNLYRSSNDYTNQLRALEIQCSQSPSNTAAHFLLAYHYLLCEHHEQAAGELRQVVQLEPNDQLAAQLLQGLTTPAKQPPPSNQPPAPARPVDTESLVGHWKASRPDGSSFDLDLQPDKKFTWRFQQKDQVQEFSGTYTLANNFLILAAGDQNSLVGNVALEERDKLSFRLAGGNPSEPGLSFTR